MFLLTYSFIEILKVPRRPCKHENDGPFFGRKPRCCQAEAADNAAGDGGEAPLQERGDDTAPRRVLRAHHGLRRHTQQQRVRQGNMRQQQRPLLHGAKFESFTGTCKKPIFYGELSTFIYCRTIAVSATSDPTATSGSLSACTSSAMTSSTASTKPKRRDSSPSTSSGPSRTTTTWSLARRRTIIISRWSLGTSARAPLRWKCHLPWRWPRSAW